MRVWRHLGTWGSVQRPYHLQCPEVCYRYRCLRRWALCTRNVNFPAFCRCESILGRKSTNVICSFHFLSFRIHFLSCSFHFAFMSFHCPFMLHSCPFNFEPKVICSNRSCGYPPKRSHSCNLQGSWTCTCTSSLSLFYSYRFLGQPCISSVKVQAKLLSPGLFHQPK